MSPLAMRRLAVAAAAVPVACGTVASVLYFLGGGWNACNPYDFVIFGVGFPGVLVADLLPIPEAIDSSSVLLRMIWDPALFNFLLLWGPIAGLLWLWSRTAPAKSETAGRFWNSYTLISAGLLYAVAITFLSFGFVGGGHGWVEAMYAAPFALVLCPALGAAIGLRGTHAGRTLLVLVIIGAVMADFTIYHTTDWSSEYSRFRRVADSPWMIAWFLVWLLWQAYAINMLFQREPALGPGRTSTTTDEPPPVTAPAQSP
jgi:hypothetical protein